MSDNIKDDHLDALFKLVKSTGNKEQLITLMTLKVLLAESLEELQEIKNVLSEAYGVIEILERKNTKIRFELEAVLSHDVGVTEDFKKRVKKHITCGEDINGTRA